MTVTQTPAELEAYAARAMREGRYADAAHHYKAAGVQNPGQTVAQQSQANADALLAAAATLSSHTPAGYSLPQQCFMLGAGTLTVSGAITQSYVGGTAAALGGGGGFGAKASQIWVAGTRGSFAGQGALAGHSP